MIYYLKAAMEIGDFHKSVKILQKYYLELILSKKKNLRLFATSIISAILVMSFFAFGVTAYIGFTQNALAQNITNQTGSQTAIPLPPAVPQPTGEAEPIDSFAGRGGIDSMIYTVNGNFHANGTWLLRVSDGMLTSFNSLMTWTNQSNPLLSHTHELQNFEAGDEEIERESDGSMSLEGEMDVGTRGVITWPDVPAEIFIEGGKIITISLDNDATDNHFADQPVHGIVTSFTPCPTTPGPSMQVPLPTTGC